MIKATELQRNIEGKPKGWMVLLEADPKNMVEAGVSAIKFFLEKSHHGIVLSAMNSNKLLGIYSSFGLDLKKLTVIDISQNVRDLENPFEVANVVIEVNKVLRGQKKGQKRFVYLNSINDMLAAHGPESSLKFLHGILTRIRIREISGVVLATQSTIYDRVKSELEQLCDRVIKV